jgi:hypothetical protein
MWGLWKHNTFALDALMSYAVQHWATMIAESGWEIRVIDPFVFLYFWGLMEKWERDAWASKSNCSNTLTAKCEKLMDMADNWNGCYGQGYTTCIRSCVKLSAADINWQFGLRKRVHIGYNRQHRYENVNRNKMVALKSRRKVKIKNNVNQKLFI